jgi:hypothetical protein
MKAERDPRAPKEQPKKGDDDWLSPLISLSATLAGTYVGGPAAGIVSGLVGDVVGKSAAKAAGMEETGVTRALDAATSLGAGLAGATGVTGPESAVQKVGVLESEAAKIPALAQSGVQSGQQMAMQVAADGLGESSMARTPMSQLAYDYGADAPRQMEALPLERMQASGAMGVVPTQGLVYEATPEAAQARRDAMLNDFLARRESRYMQDPFYSQIRQDQQQMMLGQEISQEADQYRQQLGLSRRDIMEDELRKQAESSFIR